MEDGHSGSINKTEYDSAVPLANCLGSSNA